MAYKQTDDLKRLPAIMEQSYYGDCATGKFTTHKKRLKIPSLTEDMYLEDWEDEQGKMYYRISCSWLKAFTKDDVTNCDGYKYKSIEEKLDGEEE